MVRGLIVRRLWFLLPVTVAAGLLAMFALSVLRGGRQEVLPAALIDQPAPQAILPAPPGLGAGVDIAGLRGQVTLVNFFASWCVPCLAEHPILTQLGGRADLRLIGIANRDAPDDVIAWLERNGNPFAAVGLDPENRLGIDWGAYGVPESYLLDAEGIIRYRHIGALTQEAVQEILDPLIAELRP